MSQESRPMVAGGRSSGEKTIGVPVGFPPLRRHYRLGRLAGKREEVARFRTGPVRLSQMARRRQAMVVKFPTEGEFGRRREKKEEKEKKRKEKRRKRRARAPSPLPGPTLITNTKKYTHLNFIHFYPLKNFTI
ncbi:hypothetical protein ACLB2K_020886 [Fragaria x ananassa]